MEKGLAIIVFSWLAAISGLFLFSQETKQAKINSNYANITQLNTTSPIIPPPTVANRTITPKTEKLNLTTTTILITITSGNMTTASNTTTTSTSQLQQPAQVSTTNQIYSSIPTNTTTTTAPAVTTTTIQQSQKININTANSQELEKITGVGPVIAQRIVDYRNANGPFQKIEDIKNVNGIGDVKFEKMKDEITI